MVRPTTIDLNLVETTCYPYMISLDKCNGSCNVWCNVMSENMWKKQKTKMLRYLIWQQIKMKLKQWKTKKTYFMCLEIKI